MVKQKISRNNKHMNTKKSMSVAIPRSDEHGIKLTMSKTTDVESIHLGLSIQSFSFISSTYLSISSSVFVPNHVRFLPTIKSICIMGCIYIQDRASNIPLRKS